MRYKPLPATAQHTARIPRLDGGLNLRDVPTAVADNQLTACRNLWWQGGTLCARPGISVAEAIAGHYNITQPLAEGEMLFMSYLPDDNGERRFYAALLTADGTRTAIGRRNHYVLLPHDASAPLTAFGCRAPRGAGYDFIFFLGGGEIVTYALDTGYWTYASPYVPHISTDGAPTAERRAGSPAGKALESGNLLSDTAVCTYTTDGVGTYFYLPDSCRGAALSMTLTMYDPAVGDVITIDPTVSRSFTPAAFDLDEAKYTAVTLGYSYTPARGIFRLYGTATLAAGGTETVPLPADSRNNLRVTASGYRGYDPARICRMTLAAWFGGDRSGVGGGTRLFLAGDGDHPNRLCWSQVDDPLYFPQDNVAYVGDSGSPITALGRQGDLLILFKERELYAAEYVADNDPIDQGDTVVAAHAYFPLTPLHATVGCDCPHTIRLVNNKLVWMTAAGQLYTLTGVNPNSERNVRQIGALIAPALTAHTPAERRAACGGEYDGWYLLHIGGVIYLLDCRCAAFHNYGQYADEDAALSALVYYRWEMPHGRVIDRMLSGGDSPLLLVCGEYAVDILALGGERDGTEPIPVSFSTKRYAAADPTRRISVPTVYLGISDTAARVRVTYHTDGGDIPDTAVIEGGSPAPDQRVIRPRRLAPGVHRAAHFGITCESEDAFAVADLTIITRTDGVVR